MKLSDDGKTLLKVTNRDIKEDGSFDFPAGVTSIGDNAFEGCSVLQRIIIPKEIITIGEYAFYKCSKLKHLVISEGVTFIGFRAFGNCSGLEVITIQPGVTTIDGDAFFGCSRVQSITIPSGVTSIRSSVFEDCSGLQTITIAPGVTSFRHFLFAGCSGLQNITIPDGVTYIGYCTFLGCSGLLNLTIPKGVVTVDMWAFKGCSSLQTITLPEEIVFIDKTAFNNCPSLHSIVIASQNEEVKKRIIALLPDFLKSKVTTKDLAEVAFKIRKTQLSRLLKTPEINPLFRFFHVKSHHSSSVHEENGIEQECSKLPGEMFQEINQFCDDNRYYQKAQRHILCVPLPTNAGALQDYTNKIKEIINECISKAKEFKRQVDAVTDKKAIQWCSMI
ncbi:leucine-rich repeat domain-containing protein [Legionella fallonii]|uniref:leucine-rich repeat domain-containing protein n=1 Tax=Legionella fallonii TaxID=96230 RepID=UPI000695E5A8|nr:leucine-rich repeat domain-containing protein [Legionella fallonii]